MAAPTGHVARTRATAPTRGIARVLALVFAALGAGCTAEDRAPPTAPAEVRATASATKIDLSWAPSSDDIAVAGYHVLRDTVRVASVRGTVYSDTGLEPGTRYGYTLVAYDAAGRVSQGSVGVTATTTGPGPGAPSSALTPGTSNPQWLYYGDGRPYFLTGSGGPEGFLYRGERLPDGTRAGGDQDTLIDALAEADVNGLYLMAVRSHGGDGETDHNPWLGSDPGSGLNGRILDQWDGWFERMDRAGITIFLVLYDDDADPFGGTSMSRDEADFVGAMVDRFRHHNHLIWVVAEEYSEELSRERASGIAARIRTGDSVHPIAVHQHSSTTFDFADDPSIDQFAMQLGDRGHTADSPAELHERVVEAWRRSDGRYNVNLSELNNRLGHAHHPSDEIRQLNWAAAMGGAYVMVLYWWEQTTPSAQELAQLGYLRAFMESTRFDLTEPADQRAAGDTEWLLAQRTDLGNRQFIGYGRDVANGMGFTGLEPGRYDLTWLDPRTGETYVEQRLVPDTAFIFPRPADLPGPELALHARRTPE